MSRTSTKGCPCEVCKHTRAERYAVKVAKREAAAAQEWELALQRERFESVNRRIEASKDATWLCGDGKAVRVQAMNGAHLFYAIAKGLRCEYGNSRSLTHLKNEALRRLLANVT